MENLIPKVGNDLSIDTKAHILVSKHYNEAIDLRHRYGNNLQPYYKVWSKSSPDQHFFFWLDFGDGKEVDLEECPRSKLDQQCVKYFGPREYYEYVVVDGNILHNMTRTPLHHEPPHLKYIFVVSRAKKLYIGKRISPSSGHYKPTEDSFERFLSILKQNGVNLDEVEIRKENEDFVSPKV